MSETTDNAAGERKHHPDCPALYFADHPERCRCTFMAMLDRPATPDADDASTGASEPLGEGERRAFNCWCIALDGVRTHVRFCPVPTVERIVAAREAAARAEGAAEALREAADALGQGATMRWLYERESCDWWGDRPVADWLRDRAARIEVSR